MPDVLDECECGDYRRAHRPVCRVCRCESFRLFLRAGERDRLAVGEGGEQQ